MIKRTVWTPYLPDPSDRHESPLRPTKAYRGIYVFQRDPWDTEVKYIEPGAEADYLLEWFELETVLKVLFKYPEEVINTIMDRLWGFNEIFFDSRDPHRIILDPKVALETWPALLVAGNVESK